MARAIDLLLFSLFLCKTNQLIMLKHSFFFGLMLLGLAACTDPATTTDTTSTDVDTPQTAIPAVPATADPATSGKNYEVKVVDATIKSPRKELSGKAGDVDLVINYGSPAVNDRVIYGDLVPYNKVWRTGANEATRITFPADVMVGESNKKLAAGTYALFTLPSSKDDWTIIFNKVADQWGAYDYEESADAVRIKGMAKPASRKAERMDFALDGNNIELMWDDLMVAFPVSGSTK